MLWIALAHSTPKSSLCLFSSCPLGPSHRPTQTLLFLLFTLVDSGIKSQLLLTNRFWCTPGMAVLLLCAFWLHCSSCFFCGSWTLLFDLTLKPLMPSQTTQTLQSLQSQQSLHAATMYLCSQGNAGILFIAPTPAQLLNPLQIIWDWTTQGALFQKTLCAGLGLLRRQIHFSLRILSVSSEEYTFY